MPSTKILLTAATICFLLALAVPTAAITVGEDPASDDVVLEPVDADYATLENDTLELAFAALNDEAETTFADVFSITVGEEADDLEEIWIDHDVDGVTFYTDDGEVTADSRLEPASGETVTVGVAVDTRVTDADTEGFTVHVLYEDEEPADVPDEGGGGTAPASVSTTDLEVSLDDPFVGDDLLVTATYENTGGESETVLAELVVDGVVVDRQPVTVSAGASETVTFERTLDSPGTVTLEVGDQMRTVDVDADGAAIVLEDATIADDEVEPGEPVVVEATYVNEGDQAGEFTGELAVGGAVVDSQSFVLESDESVTVTFEWTLETAGSYELTVDGTVVGSSTVTDDDEITIVNRELSASTAAAVVPPLAAGILFLIPVVRRNRAVWDPSWTEPGG
ncbi:CARDB domain-containing protein [Natrialbaceae archaeon A-gly3]